MRLATLLLFAILFGTACSEPITEYPPPKLSPDEAVEMAADFLKQEEASVSDYEVALVGFNYIDRTWRISYRGKSGVLHDEYWLKVSDEGANEVTLLPL